MTAHFISLNCASCGGILEVYDDMERFACGYCGTDIAVQRQDGTTMLIGANKAADLRLKEEAQSLSKRREVMLNDKIERQTWGYLIGAVLLLVGFFVVRSYGFVMGLSVLMAGILTISKAILADVRM